MTALLGVRDLVKHYRTGGRVVHAVQGLSFELERTARLGLVGESGCGKSSVARCLVGLERASSGSIRLDGLELTRLDDRGWFPLRRRIQIVFQDPFAALDPRQNAASIVGEPLAIHRLGKPRERRLRALELLEAVGLSAAHSLRYPHEFSGGQCQRIGIARALALEPEILVLDEPVSALDVSIQAQIVNLLAELAQRFELSYLFISHDLAVVQALCARVAVMYLGRIVEEGPCAQVFAAPAHPYTQALLSAVPLADPVRERLRRCKVTSGEPPSPLAPPEGCAFHPRCPARAQVPERRCERERPELRDCTTTTEGPGARRAACHLLESSASEQRNREPLV